MLPKRRKPEKLGVRERPQYRSDGHRQWIRGHECAAAGIIDPCDGKIEAAHARTGTDGAKDVKPSDWWTLPLCGHHHRSVQHSIGEREFEKRYRIDMKAIAKALWDKSPHRLKLLRP